MSRKKILLVVEGAKQEVKLFNALFACYEPDLDYEIVSYGTNIYELYERMFSEGIQDELFLLGVLKERALAKDRDLFDQDYSDVLLVFDFDPQDDRFSSDRLSEMQAYFNESTENGKLYVNYPMVEACKHFLEIPDLEFLNRTVAFDDLRRYKSIVGNASRYQSFERDFKRPAVDSMIVLTAIKALMLSGCDGEGNYALSYGGLNHDAVLGSQIVALNARGEIWVLGMCLLFVLDYSTSLIDFEGIEAALRQYGWA